MDVDYSLEVDCVHVAHVVVLWDSGISLNGADFMNSLRVGDSQVMYLDVESGHVHIRLEETHECGLSTDEDDDSLSEEEKEEVTTPLEFEDTDVGSSEDQQRLSATFSAMMRFFQKHNASFSWNTKFDPLGPIHCIQNSM